MAQHISSIFSKKRVLLQHNDDHRRKRTRHVRFSEELERKYQCSCAEKTEERKMLAFFIFKHNQNHRELMDLAKRCPHFRINLIGFLESISAGCNQDDVSTRLHKFQEDDSIRYFSLNAMAPSYLHALTAGSEFKAQYFARKRKIVQKIVPAC